MRQGGLILAAGRVRSKKNKKNKKTKNPEKICPIQNTPRNPHQLADRDHLETTSDERRWHPVRTPV